MLALAHRLGTVDCHRENFIASGEHPLLVDAEALLHAPASGGDMLPSLLRTGFLPLPNRTAGSEFSASALSKSSGAHRPTLNGQPCDASGYQGELTDGFRLAQSLLTGTIEGRRAFQRRVAALEKLPWRRIVRPTAIYAELCERSLQPAAMRSLNERLRLIRTGCERAGASARIVRAEIDAITQLDIPYFTGRSKAAKPDLTAEALLATALRQSFTR
jgi:lantibiotic modifying enzyme